MLVNRWILVCAALAAIGPGLVACGDDVDSPGKGGDSASTSNADSDELVTFSAADKAFRDSLKFDATPNNDLADSAGRKALLAFDFIAHDRKGAEVRRFDKPVDIVIRYGGVPLGSVDDNDLTIVYFNPDSTAWEDVPSTVDSSAKTVTASVEHFSKFGVAIKATGGTASSSGGAAAGGAAQGTVTKDGTPIGGGQGAAGGAVKYDVTTALNAFSQAVYGRTFSYTDTGAAAAGVVASLTFPSNDKGILTAKIGAAGVAAYGKMSNGAEVAMTGFAGAITNDAAADIVAGGLGEVAIGGFAAPGDQNAALELVKQVAPKLASVQWTKRQASGGTYVFYASGFINIQTGHGSSKTNFGAMATVTPAPDGKAIVSVGVGTGSQANAWK
ncbi:MAG: hypothetical protein HS107_07875 [Thermoflexaceae bacterium]|nr:hypothetical protein [Thermoflexaceae bacterium]